MFNKNDDDCSSVSSNNSAMDEAYMEEKELKRAQKRLIKIREKQVAESLALKKAHGSVSSVAQVTAAQQAILATVAAVQKQEADKKIHAKQVLEEKKKLLWGKKKEETSSQISANQWETVSFDGNEQRKSKFLSMMGAKAKVSTTPSSSSSQTQHSDLEKQSSHTLEDLERQYELGRTITLGPKTGLGFRNH
eukprot:c8707_g2_i1.p1 GENE.c8707_g2_i1~~c8707_g2_i1.p1  ORF type:complete len:203 (+),score=79.92 c8707_g2_i1:35-610(+)